LPSCIEKLRAEPGVYLSLQRSVNLGVAVGLVLLALGPLLRGFQLQHLLQIKKVEDPITTPKTRSSSERDGA
jgi:hypothetical protein